VKKRVVYVLQARSFGGAEQMTLDLLKAVDYQKTYVALVSIENFLSPFVSRMALPVECLPSPAPPRILWERFYVRGRYSSRWWQAFSRWFHFLVGLHPDKIILGNAFYEFSLAEVLAAFCAARGNLYMIENSVPLERPSSRLHFGFVPGMALRWRRAALPLCGRGYVARRILAASEGVRDRIMDWNYPPAKIWVTRHGIDTSRFLPAPDGVGRRLRATFGVPRHARVVVSTARLSKEKRVDRLIRAFDSLAGTYRDVWLLLIGDGPLKSQLMDLAQSSCYPQRIKFFGHSENVVPALQASDIYVLPSDSESFGLGLLEAMASQLVCVATRTHGPSKIIDRGKNGLLVDINLKGVTEGLAKALELNAQERAAMGRQARHRVLEAFQLEDAVRLKLTVLGIDRAVGGETSAPRSTIQPDACCFAADQGRTSS
jgi:glycosyltransferase involved in cell wall biosynthesis